MTAIELNDVSNPYRALTVSDDVSLTLKKERALSIIKQLWAVKDFPKAFIGCCQTNENSHRIASTA
jgi:hypothetical protein